MTVFLLGAVTLAGAWRLTTRSTRRFGGQLWVVVMGVLVAGQIWWQRDRLASYHVRLLAQRFHVTAAANGAPARARAISGDRDRADIHVPGVGAEPVAVLEAGAANDTAPVVSVVAAGGTLGVVAVRTARGWRGGQWTVLRSVAVEPGDRIRVRRDGAEAVLVFERSPGGILGRLGVRGTQDEVVVRTTAENGTEPGSDVRVTVPYPEGAGVLGLLPRRPSVFQRTYPLADLMVETGAVEESAQAPGAAPRASGASRIGAVLRSFLYYDRGAARVAVLDDGVEVLAPSGAVRDAVRRLPAWTGPGVGPLFSVAGLPYRDFPEPRLASVERYGIRPLRSFRARVDEGWLTVQAPRAEIHPVALAGLPGGRRIERTEEGEDLHPLRLSAGAAGASADIPLGSPANGFAAAAQAVLRVPDEPAAGWFELLAPSGLARWETGRPFTLSDGDRGLLLRVDGLGISWGFHLLLGALFLLAAIPFALFETSGATRTVALAGLGLASLRLLASLSAKAHFPFVDEGHQISLWLIPAIPWIVTVVASGAHRPSRVTGHRPGHRSHPPGHRPDTAGVALTPRGFSGGFMGADPEQPARPRWFDRVRNGSHFVPAVRVFLAAALVFLAVALFPDSRAKAATLSAMVVALAGLALAPVRLSLRSSLLRGIPAPWTGVGLGAALFLARVLLDIAGFREQLTVAGTRIGLSVLYTPAALICFALLLAGHDRRVRAARPAMAPAASAIAWLDLAGFLLLAYAATSIWISDFGIVFTTLPGPLLVLALAGWRWSRRAGPGAALLGALPVFLFLVLQVAPDLARPRLSGDIEVASRLEDWSRNELLLLERGDPEALRLIGESRSEALGVMRETMRSYTRGNWAGRGFLAGRVSPQIRTTATREHLVTGLLASQWGLLGSLGLTAMLIAVIVPVAAVVPMASPKRRRRPRRVARAGPSLLAKGLATAAGLTLLAVVLPSPANALVLGALIAFGLAGALAPVLLPATRGMAKGMTGWLWSSESSPEGRPRSIDAPTDKYAPADNADFDEVADTWRANPLRILSATALISFSAAGVYMILANYGLVLFTGKNVYLLGLDSLSDTLEALALLVIGAGALAIGRSAGKQLTIPEAGTE